MQRLIVLGRMNLRGQFAVIACCLCLSIAAESSWTGSSWAGSSWAKEFVVYQHDQGVGNGKHVVLLTGDEEYRSEEGLVQLAKILAFRHGFRATVLFAIDPKDGSINPNVNNSLPGVEALDSADVMVLGLRFRHYPDETMRSLVAAYLSGKPMVAVRTSTHAFNYPEKSQSKYARYSFRSQEWPGGFGRQVLGETWAGHLGTNHQEATRGIPFAGAKDHLLLRGVGEVFATSGAYKANPLPDSTILMHGQVLAGMTPNSPPNTEGKNEPLQPIAWSRNHKNETGNTNRILCTTMGAATDLLDENFRRLLVNGVYWGLEMEVPQQADVRLIGSYQPSDYSFYGFRKNVRPSELAMSSEEALADEPH
jgi:hypothetical protein